MLLNMLLTLYGPPKEDWKSHTSPASFMPTTVQPMPILVTVHTTSCMDSHTWLPVDTLIGPLLGLKACFLEEQSSLRCSEEWV